MPGKVSFHSLIEALSSAVIEAQDSIERHQVANLRAYFDEDNRPRSVTLRIPSLHPDAEHGDEDLYRAPLLPLVSRNNLRIKDVEISFDADLGELGDEPVEDAGGGRPDGPEWVSRRGLASRLGVDTGRAVRGQGSVRVVLRVEGSEATEGAVRLINQLSQAQGVFKTIKAK